MIQSATQDVQVKRKTLSAALKIPVLNIRTTTQKTKQTHKKTNKNKNPNDKGMVHYGNLRLSP